MIKTFARCSGDHKLDVSTEFPMDQGWVVGHRGVSNGRHSKVEPQRRRRGPEGRWRPEADLH
jgi:hypothetical protein